MTPSVTYAVGERRTPKKGGTVWTVIATMPHRNGDPAHLRIRAESGRERTVYACDWATWRPA